MKESTKKLIQYLQDTNDVDQTAADVAEALDMAKKSVDGSFTAAIQRKNLGFREEAEIKDGDSTKKVKFLRLNQAGMDFDVNAEDKKED